MRRTNAMNTSQISSQITQASGRDAKTGIAGCPDAPSITPFKSSF
jgi:hypothetical protein